MNENRAPGTLLYTGSTKDIFSVDEDSLLFRFTDRYSIFDWGQMPDAIPGKGEASALFATHFFELLSSAGIQHHYLKPGPSADSLIVREAETPRDDANYYSTRPSYAFVPLEVIFRLGIPVGSSVLKRIQTPQQWADAGYDRVYGAGEFLPYPMIECTTKWEATDRFVVADEAKQIAGLNSVEWARLQLLASRVATELAGRFKQNGAELWDGKIEVAFLPGDQDGREFQVVDSLGLDELRLTLDGRPLSKEILRQHYLSSAWLKGLKAAKQIDREEFKRICLDTVGGPEPLPSAFLKSVAEIYRHSPALLEKPGPHARASIEQLRKELQSCAS